MPTIYTGRPPTSFTVSKYNEGTWGDSEPWGGVTINYTQWSGRSNLNSYLWVSTVQPWRSDIRPWLLTGPTTFTGRTPI